MYAFLHAEPVVDRQALRAEARAIVESSALIRACGEGQLDAIHALLVGFWPYVEGFERAIDWQVARMPIKPLINRFGRERVRAFFHEARLTVREMKEEEGSHAALWQRGADQLGVTLGEAEPVDGVKRLLEKAWVSDPMLFFCWLAGTEYIAEELARYLCNSPRFLAVFPGNRWLWGEAHVAEHEGPSHLEIDEDLARAYHASEDSAEVSRDMSEAMRDCEHGFFAAGQDVLSTLMQAAPIAAASEGARTLPTNESR